MRNNFRFWSLWNDLLCLDRMNTDDTAKLLLLLWRTWHVRNNLTHDTGKLSIMASMKFLCKYWEELCTVQHNNSFDPKGNQKISSSLMAGRESKSKRQVAKWKPPPSDWVKINVDGAFDEQIGEAVIGIVIRNDQGKVKLGDIFSKVAMQRRSKRLHPRWASFLRRTSVGGR